MCRSLSVSLMLLLSAGGERRGGGQDRYMCRVTYPPSSFSASLQNTHFFSVHDDVFKGPPECKCLCLISRMFKNWIYWNTSPSTHTHTFSFWRSISINISMLRKKHRNKDERNKSMASWMYKATHLVKTGKGSNLEFLAICEVMVLTSVHTWRCLKCVCSD